MSIKTSIFKYTPILVQNILISFYGYLLIKQRYGKEYFRYRKQYVNDKAISRDELLRNQNIELNNFISFALAKSPFYQEMYKGIDITKGINLDTLKELPIVNKEVLRANINDVYTIDPSQGISSFTGGTTGKSLQVLFTKSDMQKRMAYLDAFKLKLGIDPFTARKATFSGREFTRGWATNKYKIFWRNNWAFKQRLYSTFDLVEKNIPHYINDLNEYRPSVINGFVSAIYELAKFIERNQLSLQFKVDAIFTTSETLLPFHRELIERIFNCHVYNQYASAEGAPFITECIAGNLHYNVDTGVIETLEVATGSEMLVTSFTTHGTPLIRYRIGDLIQFKKGQCTCGSEHPLVESIEGRQVEHLESKEFGKVSLSHLSDVIKGLPNCIKSVQFQQRKLEEILVLLNVDQQLYDKHAEQKITKALELRFGYDTAFIFELVNNIPREKSGKYMLIKNYLKNDGAL